MNYNHKEAFCLMYYENKETKLGFLVWNSRDGVTPFIVFEDGKEFMHEHWSFDKPVVPGFANHDPYIQNQILVPGQRIFRDATKEENRQSAVKRLESAKGTEFEVKPEDYDETLASLINTMNLDTCPVMCFVKEKGVMP